MWETRLRSLKTSPRRHHLQTHLWELWELRHLRLYRLHLEMLALDQERLCKPAPRLRSWRCRRIKVRL